MERNNKGLYDTAVPGMMPPPLVLSPEDIERQLEGGAFLLDWDEAAEMGFINPYDDTNSSVSVRSAS